MNTQQSIYDVVAELMQGAVYDMESISMGDANLIADILEQQHYELRVYPEFSLLAAVPGHAAH